MKKTAVCLMSFVTAFQVQALSFKTTIYTNNIPKLMTTAKLPDISYSAPGEMSINVKRMCGDGDVVHFASVNPDFEFVPDDAYQVPAIMGAWVAKGSSDLPEESKWVPLGHMNITVPHWGPEITPKPVPNYVHREDWAKTTGKFNLFSNLATEVPGLDLINSGLKNLTKLANNRFDKSQNYKIYSGLFVCLNPQGSGALGTSGYRVTTLDLAQTFGDTNFFTDAMAVTAVNDAVAASPSSLRKNIYFKLKDSASQTEIGSATESTSIFEEVGSPGAGVNTVDLSSSSIAETSYNVTKQLLDLSYPGASDVASVSAYKSYMQTSKLSSTFLGTMGVADLSLSKEDFFAKFCNKFSLDGSQKFWEVFENMKVSCSVLSSDNGQFQKDIAVLFNPTTVPSTTEFDAAKVSAAKILYKAASSYAVQKFVDDNKTDNTFKYASVEKPHCFQKAADGHYIGKILYSVPFRFSVEDGDHYVIGKPSEPSYLVKGLHPEPLFALNNYFNEYSTSSSDIKTIFGMIQDNAVASPSSTAIETNNPSVNYDEMKAVNDKSFDIEIQMRSVSGSCPVFC